MDKLEIPDKGVDDVMLIHPINDWLAKKKRRKVFCVTVGDPWVGFRQEAVLLITRMRVVRQSQNAEPPVEGDRDRDVKKWLVERGAREEILRWTTVPDAEELHMFYSTGMRPRSNDFRGPYVYYRFNADRTPRLLKSLRSGKSREEWVAEALANGEVMHRIWPPM